MEDEQTPLMCPSCTDDGIDSPLYLPLQMLNEIRLTIKMELLGMCLVCGTSYPCYFCVSDDDNFEEHYDYHM